MTTLKELMSRPLPTVPMIEDLHPKPWRLIVSQFERHACIVDDNCPADSRPDECIVIGRVKYRTDYDKLLARHIVEQLNKD